MTCLHAIPTHIHHSPKSKKKIIISKHHSLPADSTHHYSQSSFLYCQSHESFQDHANRKIIFTKQRLLSDSNPSRLMSCDFIFTCCGKFLIKNIFTSIPQKVPSPSPLGLGWFAAAAPNRQTSVQPPGLVIPLTAQCHPSPMTYRQHSPTSPDARSTRVHIEFHPDSIPKQAVSHPDSR